MGCPTRKKELKTFWLKTFCMKFDLLIYASKPFLNIWLLCARWPASDQARYKMAGQTALGEPAKHFLNFTCHSYFVVISRAFMNWKAAKDIKTINIFPSGSAKCVEILLHAFHRLLINQAIMGCWGEYQAILMFFHCQVMGFYCKNFARCEWVA